MTGTDNNSKKATFGAGCFWGVEAAFRKVNGVLDTAVGYMGGTMKNPTYEDVCTGQTGHAEVVQVTYDPDKVRYDKLLDLFWSIHDPTQLNRQGPDIGSNYRSVIFYHDAEQGKTARISKEGVEVSGRFGFGKVVTRIVPATEFYRAEDTTSGILRDTAAGAAISDTLNLRIPIRCLNTDPEYVGSMQVSDILQLIATLIEIVIAVVAVLIATQKKKTYGWFIALTFVLFVVFDLARIFALGLPADLHSLILLAACLSMLYAVWMVWKEKEEGEFKKSARYS